MYTIDMHEFISNWDIMYYIQHSMCDVNEQDLKGGTGIYWATARNHVKVLQLLLEHRGDPNIKACKRYAIHLAAGWDYIACLELLIQYGADMNALDDEGHSALDIAVERGHTLSIRVLQKYKEIERAERDER